MLNKEIPFLRLCVPLCIGIIARLWMDPGNVVTILLILFSTLLLALSFFFNNRLTNTLFGFALFITLFSAGLILHDLEKESITELDGSPALFSGTLTDYPEEKERSFMLTVELSHTMKNGLLSAVNGKMVLYHKKDSAILSLKPGDILKFRCTPIPITNRGNPYEFNYRFYMESRGIKYYAFTAGGDILSSEQPERRKLRHTALIIRNRIIGMYKERGLTGERLALAAAITLGEKDGLDNEQKQNFIKAGVMHIMAVSGLHAMILSLFVFNLLFFLRRRFNIIRVILTISFLWGFAFITGLTPSVMRATLMFSFLQAGNLLNRRVNGINSILASAFILILIRPPVIFDAGFLLSYSAVIFIILFYNDLHNLALSRFKIADLIWQSAAVTIVAQAGTLPLSIMLFNRFPTLFILTNALIVPLSSLVVITGCMIPFLFPLVKVSSFLTLIFGKLTDITEYLTSKAASVPWSTIDNIGLSMAECITLFIFIMLVMSFLVRRPRISPVYPLAALLAFTTSFAIKNITTGYGGEIIVYNTPGYSTIGFKNGKSLLVFSENGEIPPEVIRHRAVLGLKTDLRMITDSVLMVRTGNKLVAICEDPRKGLGAIKAPDILILTGRKLYSEKDLYLSETGKMQVILTASDISKRLSGSLSDESASLIRSVKESGAIRIKL